MFWLYFSMYCLDLIISPRSLLATEFLMRCGGQSCRGCHTHSNRQHQEEGRSQGSSSLSFNLHLWRNWVNFCLGQFIHGFLIQCSIMWMWFNSNWWVKSDEILWKWIPNLLKVWFGPTVLWACCAKASSMSFLCLVCISRPQDRPCVQGARSRLDYSRGIEWMYSWCIVYTANNLVHFCETVIHEWIESVNTYEKYLKALCGFS